VKNQLTELKNKQKSVLDECRHTSQRVEMNLIDDDDGDDEINGMEGKGWDIYKYV
jgi:hypothetical protein